MFKIGSGHLPMRAKRAESPKQAHCAVRAKERYGIHLTDADIRKMARRCHQGEGLMETKQDGIRYHALVVGEQVLWVVYRRPKHAGRKPYGTIVTIMPPKIGNQRSQRDHMFMNKRIKRFK